uniref:Uncharacterized protein n=1 Tax=Lactuca sativa TaxID=4236 RepID=A0A9R1VXE9_LACSA|nr:hypothetical protein LSAT_V11C400213810 [Lactuca sativa]
MFTEAKFFLQKLVMKQLTDLTVDFLERVAVDDDDGGREMAKEVLAFPPSWDDLLSHPSFENTCFNSYAGDMNESYGFVGQGVRIRTRIPRSGFDGSPENQEFGRDASKLDYFSVAAFDVYGDDHLTGAASYGGGGGRRDGGIVLAPEQERGGATDVAGEAVVQRLEQERGDRGDSGGRRSRRLMMGTRLEEERGNATAGAGGGDRTREIPGGIFGNSGGDGGEVIVKRLKQEGATVAVPVVVVQAVGLMMMVIVIRMVLVMVKKEVWW